MYHVIQRGVARRKIFTRKGDEAKFLDILGDVAQRYGHRIHAYCLMNNHVHLAMQAGDQPLGRAMQSLFGRYGQWFNRTRKRSGHLFQDRYRAILVDKDAYLSELVRYIHLNPVRVGAVGKPEAYRWSSHRHYLSDSGPEWLVTDLVLGTFSTRRAAAVRQFDLFVRQGIHKTVQLDFKRGNTKKLAALVPDGYAEAVHRRGQQISEVDLTMEQAIHKVSEILDLKPADLGKPNKLRRPALGRAMLAYAGLQTGRWTLAELGRSLNRDTSSLSHASRRFEAKLNNDTQVQQWYEKLIPHRHV